MPDNFLFESLIRHIGQTVTIFTTSGGLSGSGFTGTLAGIDGCTVKLITCIGAPPCCPVGSACTGPIGNNWSGAWGSGGWGGGGGGFGGGGNWGGGNWGGGFGGGCGCGGGFGGFSNWLGSITEIPIDRIVSFTHNSIS
jgi:hypothetical protein